MRRPKSLSHLHNRYSSCVEGKGKKNLSLWLPSEWAKALASLSVNCVKEQDIVFPLQDQRKKNISCSYAGSFNSSHPVVINVPAPLPYTQSLKYFTPIKVWECICTKTSMAHGFHLTSWVTSSSSPCLVILKATAIFSCGISRCLIASEI